MSLVQLAALPGESPLPLSVGLSSSPEGRYVLHTVHHMLQQSRVAQQQQQQHPIATAAQQQEQQEQQEQQGGGSSSMLLQQQQPHSVLLCNHHQQQQHDDSGASPGSSQGTHQSMDRGEHLQPACQQQQQCCMASAHMQQLQQLQVHASQAAIASQSHREPLSNLSMQSLDNHHQDLPTPNSKQHHYYQRDQQDCMSSGSTGTVSSVASYLQQQQQDQQQRDRQQQPQQQQPARCQQLPGKAPSAVASCRDALAHDKSNILDARGKSAPAPADFSLSHTPYSNSSHTSWQHVHSPHSLHNKPPKRRGYRPSRLLVAGGHDLSWRSLKSVELYDPLEGVWTPGPSLLAGEQADVDYWLCRDSACQPDTVGC